MFFALLRKNLSTKKNVLKICRLYSKKAACEVDISETDSPNWELLTDDTYFLNDYSGLFTSLFN